MSERTTFMDTIITQHFLKSYGVVCACAVRHGRRAIRVEGVADRAGRRGVRRAHGRWEVKGIWRQPRIVRRPLATSPGSSNRGPAGRTRRRTTAAGRAGARKERAASAASRSEQHGIWIVLRRWVVFRNRAPSPPGCRRHPSRGAAGVARTAPTARCLPSAGNSGPSAATRGRPPGRWPPWRSASQVSSMLPRRRSRKPLQAQPGP